jgi:hypothetical protein
MASVTLEMSADGGAFTAVPITGTGTYIATLPIMNAVSKVALRLTATDAADNILRYTFELPAEAVPDFAPTVAITAPVEGSTVSGTVSITATATDNVGVTKVDFYRGSTLISTDTTSPYSAAWNSAGVTNGTHVLTAKAYDISNNITSSNPVSINTSNSNSDIVSPVVTMTGPSNNATVSGNVTLSAVASDNSGVIIDVNFYRGTLFLPPSDLSSPYSVVWDTTGSPNGLYALTAIGRDGANNIGTSNIIMVNVSNRDRVAPVVSVTSPLDNAIVPKNAVTTITANASDNNGIISKVEFFVGNSIICTDTVTPFLCSWNVPATANKRYTLKAKAYDPAGNNKTSTGVSVKSSP